MEALLGDLREEFDVDTNRAIGSPRRRRHLEWRAWQYLGAALAPMAAGRVARALWFVVRDAWRSVRSAPGHTAGILAILTLGISAATVTFSVVDTVVFRPLPFDDGDALAVIELRSLEESTFGGRSLTPLHFLTFREGLSRFDSLAAVARRSRLALNADGERVQLQAVQATASLFDVLRVRPTLGRAFTDADESDGNHHVAVISYELWRRQFSADPNIVGRALPVARTDVLGGVTSDESLTVVGVMPRGFQYPMSAVSPPDIWTPYVMSSDERTGARRGRYLHVVGRLRQDASAELAQAEARAMAATWTGAEAEFLLTRQFDVVPLKDTLIGNARGWMLLVLGAVAVVMLIACVNVANLQLVRATRRIRELSIRASLGATRRQLLVSLLAESLLLSLAAALLSLVVSSWGIEVARAGLPADLARVSAIGLDLRVLAATIAAAVATGLLFGVVPAWQASREDLVSALKQGATTLGTARRRWRAAFVVVEVACVSVLLVGATLIIASFIRVTTADLGFDRANLLFISGDTGVDGADTTAAIERLRSLPGVTAAGAMALGSPPLVAAGFEGGGATAMPVNAADAPPDTEPIVAEIRAVSPGYFAAAGISLVSGRTFGEGGPAPEQAIVIDESVASALFGGRPAVGQQVIVFGRRTVSGVVRHVRLSGPERTEVPQIYVPLLSGAGDESAFMAGANFVVRTSTASDAIVPAIRALFAGATMPGPGAMQIRSLDEAFRNITADRRFNAGLMSIFGAIAIVIGAAGIYGVMASVVAQQRREMGLRVALGATTNRIVTGVLAQAGRYLGLGLAIGLAVAWSVSRGIGSILFEVGPTDPTVYAIVAAVMLTVGLAAALIPASRAARVDPKVVLQSE